jgi:hypothetical protein
MVDLVMYFVAKVCFLKFLMLQKWRLLPVNLKKKIISCSIAKFTTHISSLGCRNNHEVLHSSTVGPNSAVCYKSSLQSLIFLKPSKELPAGRSLLSRKNSLFSSFHSIWGKTLIFSVLNGCCTQLELQLGKTPI